MSNNGIIYLSGGMERAVNNGAAWRIECSQELVKRNYIPLDITAMDVAYTNAHGHVYMGDDNVSYLQRKSNIRRQFIYTDLRLITDNSDAVIAYYDDAFRLGSGSFSECQCAYDNNKPLFIVSAFPLDQIPSWLKALSTATFRTFEALYRYMDTLPDKILKIDRYGNHGHNNQYLCSLCGNIFPKNKQHFVSTISPLYCTPCVDIVMKTREHNADRYQFIVEQLLNNKE